MNINELQGLQIEIFQRNFVVYVEDGAIVLIKPYRDGMILKEDKDELCLQIEKSFQEYQEGIRKDFELPLAIGGSAFERKVYDAILSVGYGEVATYSDIADIVGHPNGSRAVGRICGKNPLPFVVPCHRIIGKNNSLTGYAFGLELKDSLLFLEKNNA